MFFEKTSGEEVNIFAAEPWAKFIAARKNLCRQSRDANSLVWEITIIFNKLQNRLNINPFVWHWLEWLCENTIIYIRKANIRETSSNLNRLSVLIKLIRQEAKSRAEVKILTGPATSPKWNLLIKKGVNMDAEPHDDQREKFFKEYEKELARFREVLPILLKTHKNLFIAMVNGKILDQDRDEIALAIRIHSKEQDNFVLIKKVSEDPEEVGFV